ncbi:hypothetical protein PFICI_10641 [Pestalotiopsis fici W106-1]|uniref:Uncharacterized protein n=1 Tax=Pestalotiopsis fici (strain W106-1 / CGMCC3.15140) TaxID=1229662 RepID=W3WXQ9_PESFW|nr:uncharacterized protein PFICI_10641 [Pestalotiopsis fici W106-1]ETS78579.1 hypothetical protein PFICI_10641 [Pestalotiopsis fici W106-1]
MYGPRASSQSRGSYQPRPNIYYERHVPVEREQLDDLYQSFEDMRLNDAHSCEIHERDERRRHSRPPPAYERYPQETRRFSQAYEDEYGRPVAGPTPSRVYSSGTRRSQYAPPPVGEYSGMREALAREDVDAEGHHHERRHMRPRGQTIDEPWVYRRPAVREVPSRRHSTRDSFYPPRDWHESQDLPFEEHVPVSPVRVHPGARNFSRPIGDAPARSSQTPDHRLGDARQTPTRTTWYCSSEEEEEALQSPKIETPERTSTNTRLRDVANVADAERQPRDPKVGIYINTGHQESHQSPPPRARGTTTTTTVAGGSSTPTTIVVDEDKGSGSTRERRRRHYANESEGGSRRERDSRRSTRERERSSRHHTSDEPSNRRHKSSSSRRKSTHAPLKEHNSSCIPQ